MKKLLFLILLILTAQTPLKAQSEAELRKTIDNLEASIEREEKELAKLQSNKSSKQKLVNSLARQIEKRNALIAARDKQIKQLGRDITAAEKRVGELSVSVAQLERSCSEMYREAYRNYRNNNTLAYIFSSSSAMVLGIPPARITTFTPYPPIHIYLIICYITLLFYFYQILFYQFQFCIELPFYKLPFAFHIAPQSGHQSHRFRF